MSTILTPWHIGSPGTPARQLRWEEAQCTGMEGAPDQQQHEEEQHLFGGGAGQPGGKREFYSPGFFCALPSPYLVGSRLALARSWRIPPSVYSHNPANASIHIMEKTQSTRSLPLEQEFQLAKLQAGVRACNRDKRSSLVRLRCGSLLK